MTRRRKSSLTSRVRWSYLEEVNRRPHDTGLSGLKMSGETVLTPEGELKITHCICSNTSFVEIKKIAEKHGETNLYLLKERLRFGADCRMCLPYIRRMLLTGETEFTEVIEETDSFSKPSP